MEKNKISFKDLLDAACGFSQLWLKDKRSIGLRKLIRLVYNKRANWIRKSVHAPINHIGGCSRQLFNRECLCGNIADAQQELERTWMGNFQTNQPTTYKDVIAILDKYKICDEFAD